MDIQTFVSMLSPDLRAEILVAVIKGELNLDGVKGGASKPAKPAAKRSSRKAFVAAKKAPKPAAKKSPAKPRTIGDLKAEHAKAAPKAFRLTDSGLDAKIGPAVASTNGSLGAIAVVLGVAKPKAAAALKRAIKAGDVHMAGARRFARYGTSAEQASLRAATAKDPGPVAKKTKPSVAKAHASLNGAAVVN